MTGVLSAAGLAACGGGEEWGEMCECVGWNALGGASGEGVTGGRV